MTSIDDEWAQFLNNDGDKTIFKDCSNEKIESINVIDNNVPECEDLYISTTTKVLFLNTHIDIDNMFWKLPILEYGIPKNGIVKKQMKIISKTPEDYEKYKERLDRKSVV